jgi:predicted N-acyltransferase
MIQCRVHTSIKEIDPAAWNEIIPDGLVFQTHEALRFIEEKGFPEYRPRYFVFMDQTRRILAHTAAYIIRTDLLIFSKGLIKKTVSMIRKRFPGFLCSSVLECGSPVNIGNPVIIRKGVEAEEIVRHFIGSLRSVAKAEGIQLMVLRDFHDKDRALFAFFSAAGFHQISHLPTTELEIRWKNYESYTGSMRSTFRTRLKRRERIAAQARYSASIVSEFSELGTQLAAQWMNVNRHAREFSREQVTPDFYTYIDEGLKGNCRLLKIHQGNSLQGHALAVKDGSILRWMYFGRENDDRRDGAYFFAMEQIIKLGIRLEMEKIEMALTCYPLKTDYGAKMVPLYMFMQCRTRCLTGIFARLHEMFNTTASIENKQVFKESGI